jgi:hypothetical protein
LAAVILPPLLFFAIFLFTSLVSHLQDSPWLLACDYVPSGIEPIDHDDDGDDDQEIDQLAADTEDQSEQLQDHKDQRDGPE